MEIASNFGNKFSGMANGCQRIVYEYIIELFFVATFGITTYIYYIRLLYLLHLSPLPQKRLL